jgi:CspA family cold shock protein
MKEIGDKMIRGKMKAGSGIVTFIQMKRGFGYIRDDNGEDIYFFHTGVLLPEFDKLKEGNKVKYYVIDHPKGPKAIGVTVISNKNE